ncbi:unnamed protein product, partial [Urochloa humidicola]
SPVNRIGDNGVNGSDFILGCTGLVGNDLKYLSSWIDWDSLIYRVVTRLEWIHFILL